MIKIICVGKLKENYLVSAVEDYYKRISKYHKINLIELNDSTIEKEANLIEKYISKNDYIISLVIDGLKLNSLELAKKIDTTFISKSTITFIIGGSNGIDKKIIDKSDCCLSFSNLTFPHQLFRVMLLEQIYRSFKILNNETYHK